MNVRVRRGFEDGNLVSALSKWPPHVYHYEAELIVDLNTMKVLKDRYEKIHTRPDRVLIRLYGAIEAGERVLVLT